jgi:hypothetical protein
MPRILTRMIMRDQELEVFFERRIAADYIQKVLPIYGCVDISR